MPTFTLSWNDAVGVRIQEPGVRRRKETLNGEPKAGRLFRLEIRISARHSWLLTPSILTPIELFRLRPRWLVVGWLVAAMGFSCFCLWAKAVDVPPAPAVATEPKLDPALPTIFVVGDSTAARGDQDHTG